MESKYFKTTVDTLKINWLKSDKLSFQLIFILISFLFSFVSTVKSQLNINITGSGYGFALNKDDIYYDPFGEYSNYYETSNYMSIGIGYLYEDKSLISFESSFRQSILDGSTHNPFPMSGDPEEWELNSSEFKAYNYKISAGLRYTHFFMVEQKIRLFLSTSIQLQNGYKRIEKGEKRYLLQSQNIAKNEAFEEEYKLSISNLYGDFRLGASYYFNEHFSVSLAAELSTGMVSVWRYETNAPVRKFELAFPVSVHYSF